jgi:predicted ATPase
MEEVVQTLAEERVLSGERGHYRLKRPPAELHIPATVQGVLAARIDRLPVEEKDLLQTLAVIGKEFPFGLLSRVAGAEESELRSRLSRLQAGEFIYEQPAFPEPEYTFKHALTQEVAYGSLLVERRTRLHERTARAMEELYADALDEHYGELAHHYGRTDNTPKAVEYLALAGEQAVQRSAYAEAIDQLSRGLELVETLPETRERAERELLLQFKLGQALTVTEGYAAAVAERAFAHARDLSRQVGDTPQLFRALAGLFGFHLLRAEHDTTRELAEQLLELAGATREPGQLMVAHLTMGIVSFWCGEYCQAREHLEEVISRYDRRAHGTHEYLYASMDPGVSALVYLAWVLDALGYRDQALAKSREALDRTQEISHLFSQAWALYGALSLNMFRGEFSVALEPTEALIALSSEHGFPFWVGAGTFIRASAAAELGEPEEAIATMRAVMEGMRSTGAVMGSPFMLADLARAHGRAGQAQEGLALIAEAQEFMAKTGERDSHADLHCIRGELLLARTASDPTEAEASFREALDVARGRSQKSAELRAATSLARLWQQQGRREEARDLLAPIYEWFTEGFDTQDLKDAKALLEELA